MHYRSISAVRSLVVSGVLVASSALAPAQPALATRPGAAVPAAALPVDAPPVDAPAVDAQPVDAPAAALAGSAGLGLGARSVTLVTGDRVTIAGSQLAVRPGAGRDRVGFRRYVSSGDTYVVPLDAAPLVAQGRVDRRLFNVTQLVRHGYDDATRPTLPLIVTGGAAGSLAAVAATGRRLLSVGATAIAPAKNGLAPLWSALGPQGLGAHGVAGGVQRLELDAPVRASLQYSVPQIGAPTAWQAGYTGKGALVAVLDTGIDTSHPDLTDAVLESRDFTGSATGTTDVDGHGTHVASTVAGTGAASPPGHLFRGVAPGARLLNAKVLDDTGVGTESAIIAGMEWATKKGARIVNMSFGVDFPGSGAGPLTMAVNRLSAQTGALFVVAAGNEGPAEYAIGTPADADAALTVGAVDRADHLASFSSRGPRLSDDGVKPEITAPGVEIAAAYAQHGHTDGPYLVLSGTSMAAPHVAGVAALLAGAHPDWRADRLKAALTSTALRSPTTALFGQGAGRVDAARALTQQVFSATSVLDLGVVPWPRTDDAPITTPITFINTSGAAVPLAVRADVRDGADRPAPAGMFTLSAASTTVPAAGRATVWLTANTRLDTASALYRGEVLATGPGGVSVRIPVSVHPEAERYNLTVHAIDRAGAPTGQYSVRVTNLDTREQFERYDPSGSVTLRLPRGRYFVDTVVLTPGKGQPYDYAAVGVEPEVVLGKDVALTFDARAAKPVTMTVARPGAHMVGAVVKFATTVSATEEVNTFYLGAGGTFSSLGVRGSVTRASQPFRFTAEAAFARPDTSGQFRDSPYLYNLRAVVSDGRVPPGLTRAYADSDLATVQVTDAAPAATGRTGIREGIVEAALPSTLTEYYTPDQDWARWFDQYIGSAQISDVYALPRRFAKGTLYAERWNAAVFGPALPKAPALAAYRNGDQLVFGVPMFSDQGANHLGYSSVSSAQTALYRDDARVGSATGAGTGFFDVPPSAGSYRLHAEVARGAEVSPLSSHITADWTFPSAHGPTNADLPLLVVRYAPQLDASNRAPGGRAFAVPVTVERNAVGTVRQGVTLTVEASYDDGATWRNAPLTASADGWTAALTHPAGPGFVSLRATAVGPAGSTVRQTILRAYELT